jgi:DNA-binding CsgD family transcriptional regulator
MEKHWSRLTRRQRQIADLLKQSRNQEEVARRLRISQPAISKALAGGAVRQLEEAERSLYNALASLKA